MCFKVKRNLNGDLEPRREEGCADAVHVAHVDLDADVSVVHLEEVVCALSGADVALAGEWGHGDGVPLLEQGHVVAQGSIHVVLTGGSRANVHDYLRCSNPFDIYDSHPALEEYRSV